MRHLHLNCFSGASGDMLLGALADLGVDIPLLDNELRQAGVGDFSLQTEAVTRGGIAATRAIVEEAHSSSHDHGHHGHHHGPHRHLADMRAVIEAAPFSPAVKARAQRAVLLLAEAEAAIHGKTPETVHFHEVSGIDTLVDTLGVCRALEMLEVEAVTCSAVATGSGTVECAHGTLPVPAPATLAILSRAGIPCASSGAEGELLTPTGAALLAVAVDTFGPMPRMTPERIGYGAGARDPEGRPNALRAVLGIRAGEAAERDAVAEFRGVVDDMTGEQVGFLIERCLTGGALDAYAAPVTMKKGRPGLELTVLAPPGRADAVEELLFRESASFGFRRQWIERAVLARESLTVRVLNRDVRVKVGRRGGTVRSLHPEYEDCRAAAAEAGVPLAEAQRLALAAARERIGE